MLNRAASLCRCKTRNVPKPTGDRADFFALAACGREIRDRVLSRASFRVCHLDTRAFLTKANFL